MKRIPVYDRGRLAGWAKVDEADYFELVQWCWRLNKSNYAYRHTKEEGGVPMHRQILGLTPGDGLEGDHINGDGLDNQRSNLRVTTHAQNLQNRPNGANRGSASRFRGVSPCKQTGRWKATAVIDGVSHWLGRHDTEEAAGAAAAAFRAQHMPFATDQPQPKEIAA
jgi:hypothetical protein